MNKKYKIIFTIFIITFFALVTILLAYNSLINLSYVRKSLDKYTFMIPKKLSYNNVSVNGKEIGNLYHEDILTSIITIYSSSYELAKSLAKSYVFYDCDSEIIYEDSKVLNDKNLYIVQKKLTYYDNNKTTYMFIYAYEFDSKNIFVIAVECENEEKINYYMKILEKTVKSIILY